MAEEPITTLSTEESWRLLNRHTLGRLVVAPLGRPEIFPVNYIVVQDRAIVFRTAEGTKLISVLLDHHAAFEVDEIDEDGGASVVARGRARLIESSSEEQRFEVDRLRSQVPTLKYNVVAVEIDEITGRGFRFGEEPELHPAL